MKRFTAVLLCFILSFPVAAFAATDGRIFTDDVQNTYSGRSDGRELIRNLNFRDVESSHWAKESIVRSGSLNMVKGFDTTYNPGDAVSNQEAVAFVIRAMNMESQALDEAVAIRTNFAEAENIRSMWSIGYLSLAYREGVISYDEYQSMTAAEAYEGGLSASAPVTRERLAYWLAAGLNNVAPETVSLNHNIQQILYFSDWDTIDIAYTQAVEALTRAGVMRGDSEGRFNPKSGLTRAEMAQVLRNMDNIYYNLMNIEKKAGTVGGMREQLESATGASDYWLNIYIRTSNGTMDVIQYQQGRSNPSLNEHYADAVVYRAGQVAGLESLQEGDQIEYLVDLITGEVIYVQVLNTAVVESVAQGKLYELDVENGKITIQDAAMKTYVYHMAPGVYDEEYIVMDKVRTAKANLPIGSNISLNLINDVVESISFLGTTVVVAETRGIIVENNTDYGYLSFFDNAGNLITKNYYADSIGVEKQQYYDDDDEIGYYNDMFPNFQYDPRITVIEDIEPGDIVFMRFDPDDADIITKISASTNYVAKYGKIRQITYGESVSRYLVEYEDKQTNWFDVANGIFISKGGKPIAHSAVKVGDWGKFLVNQAIIQPGYIMESVKEITIEGDEHIISNIVMGQLAGIDPIQKQLMVQNAQTLTKTGWSNYQNLQNISIASNDVEYYYENQRISLDYAQRFLARSDGEVYIALENSSTGERAKMVTFRTGRDQLLGADTILTADGSGSFAMLSNSGSIATDTGTIVRRHGRLVDSSSILTSDYTVVSLNGGNKAAVVDITDSPGVSNVMIARGRIQSVDQGNSFKVQSMSILSGNEWVYTPVQREFTIDYTTLFFDEGGNLTDINDFIDYTEASVYNQVFTIVYDGSKATRVIEAPYARYGVQGIVYEAGGGSLSIRDAQYLDNRTGRWTSVSTANPTMIVNIPDNAVIVKNNQVVQASSLVAGDRIRAMTNEFPAQMTAGVTINGYLVFVEN